MFRTYIEFMAAVTKGKPTYASQSVFDREDHDEATARRNEHIRRLALKLL